MREGVLMNEQLLKMNGLSVKILDMLSFESHLGMGYEFTTENIQTYLNDVAGVRIIVVQLSRQKTKLFIMN